MKLLLTAVLTCASAFAADEPVFAELDWNINLELQVVSLPAAQARELVPLLRDERQIGDAWQQVEALVKKGGARSEANSSTQTRHDNEVTLSAGETVRFPVQVGALQVAETKNGRAASATNGTVDVAYSVDTMETREIGIILKSSPGVSADGSRLLVPVNFERVWLTKWDEFEVGRTRTNEKIVLKQPRFFASKVVGNYGLHSGNRVLLSAHAIPDKPDEMEVAVMRVWVTPRKQTSK